LGELLVGLIRVGNDGEARRSVIAGGVSLVYDGRSKRGSSVRTSALQRSCGRLALGQDSKIRSHDAANRASMRCSSRAPASGLQQTRRFDVKERLGSRQYVISTSVPTTRRDDESEFGGRLCRGRRRYADRSNASSADRTAAKTVVLRNVGFVEACEARIGEMPLVKRSGD
jgi:hypothetical protein